MTIQPYRKADELEQLRYRLDLFFMPPGPKDWKNPVAIKNFNLTTRMAQTTLVGLLSG